MASAKKIVGVPGLSDRVERAAAAPVKAAPAKAQGKAQKAKGKSAAAAAARPPESEWTLNGAPIPEALQGKIPFRLTDQGYEEYNRGKVEGRASVTSDPLDKIHDQRERATQPWEMRDPMRELADKHVPAGYRPRFLSPRMVEKLGLRGNEIVRHNNGDAVKLGDMMLGQMPERLAQQRDAYFADLAESEVKEAVEQYNITTERELRNAKAAGLEPLKTGERVKDYEFQTEGEIGLRSTRGYTGAAEVTR